MDEIELVGIADDDSRQKWRTEFDATDEQIRDAIAAVGPMPKAVEYFLKSCDQVRGRGPSVKGRGPRGANPDDSVRAVEGSTASAVERSQREREIDGLIHELRRGAMDDVDFAKRVATLCATLADREIADRGETPGRLIRKLFLLQ